MSKRLVPICLIAALLISITASAALADDPSSPPATSTSPVPSGTSSSSSTPNSNSTCTAAHSAAIADLYACTDSAINSPEVKTAMHDMSQCYDAFSYNDAAAAQECRPLLAAYNTVLEIAQFACLTAYDKRDADIRQSCSEASRTIWCAARVAIASARKGQHADWWTPPRICTATKDSPMPITAVGRESLNRPPSPPCNDPAVTACWNHCAKDDAACFQNCSNIAASICGPRLQNSNSNLPSSQKSNLSRQTDAVQKRQGTSSPGLKSGSRDVKSKNNLDRFDLGPNYVTTDPSLPNQRRAGQSAQGNSAKQKGTTTPLAKPQMDAKPTTNPIFIDQSQGMKPTQQIK